MRLVPVGLFCASAGVLLVFLVLHVVVPPRVGPIDLVRLPLLVVAVVHHVVPDVFLFHIDVVLGVHPAFPLANLVCIFFPPSLSRGVVCMIGWYS